MTPVRPATSDELTDLRANARMVRYALAFPASNVVWSGRVNQALFSLAFMSEITWDTATGDYLDIVEGMTLWVGSAAGLYDLGVIRIRKAASATKLFFDPTSKIRFADNQYLTVVDDFPVVSKQFAYDVNSVPFANTDEAYTDQNSVFRPVVIMGGDSVVKLVEGVGELIKVGSDSWVPDGTITDYLWECSTADSIDDATTDTATFHFDVYGTHVISLTVTADNAETRTRYQKVVVWDDDHPPVMCRLETPPYEGFFDGGPECTVRVYFGVSISTIKANARVILFDYKSYFDGDPISLGQCVGSENVALSGYIVGETIQTDEATGDVTFTIRGIQGAIKKARGNAFKITRTIVAPATWGEILNPTADKLFWHFSVWQTTLADCFDCYPPDLATIYPDQEGVKGTVFEQLAAIGDKTFIVPGCDRWGRLFFQVDAEMLSDDDKDSIVEVMEITTADRSSARVDDFMDSPVSAVYGSSIWIEPTQTLPKTLYSVSPGLVEDGEGSSLISDYYAQNQADSNALAGRLYAARNDGETITVILPQNNRMISCFPRQVIVVTIASSENPRQEYTGPMVPRNIRQSYDEAGGVAGIEISGKFLRPEALSANGVIPISDGEGGYDDFEIPTDLPSLDTPSILLPELPDLPLFPGDDETVSRDEAYAMTDGGEIWFTDELNELYQKWWLLDAGLPTDGEIRTFVITPDGHIYVIYQQQIYWATVDNPKFSVLIDFEFLEAEYPGGFEDGKQIIAAYGVSPVDPNRLLLIMGSGYLGSRIGHFWSGDHTGLTRGIEVDTFDSDFYPFSNTDGTVRLVDGAWLCTYGTTSDNRAVSLQVSIDGGSIIDGAGISPDPQTGRIQAQSESQGSTVYLYRQSTFVDLVKSTDGGLTVGSSIFDPWGGSFFYVVAVSPSTERVMAIYNNTGTLELHASGDGGASFSELTLPTDFEPTTIFCIDEDKWYVAGREDTGSAPYAPLVYFTDDFGVTWFPKYGNWPIQLSNVGDGIRRIIVR